MGVKAINLFKIGARMELDVTGFCDAPLWKRLIAVNAFASPWGLKIIGSDFVLGGGGGWGSARHTSAHVILSPN